jgi:uncharacterized protein YdeI (YjbR/CyaY-like superfamily)
MKARFFPTPADFRAWLKTHHHSATELWVGFYRKETGRPSITWPESVDEALCFGWIDGIRKRIDNTSYKFRFTPRKPKSERSEHRAGERAAARGTNANGGPGRLPKAQAKQRLLI